MSLTLGGSSAYRSLSHMSSTKAKMDKSLQRISSGQRILSASDDPGGLAVAMKLKSQISSYDAQKDSVENAKSYVESQSTALQSIGEIVSKMHSLKSNFSSRSSDEQAADESEFQDLRSQLASIKGETLNGTKLFDRGDSGLTVSNVTLTDLELEDALQFNSTDHNTSAAVVADLTDLSQNITLTDNDNIDISESALATIVDDVSGLTAEAAGDESTLGFTSEYLSNMSANLETAHGRIMDVDLAEETANYASLSMQYEAAAAAVAQANLSAANVFDLLISSINRD
jgi:flagellin